MIPFSILFNVQGSSTILPLQPQPYKNGRVQGVGKVTPGHSHNSLRCLHLHVSTAVPQTRVQPRKGPVREGGGL